MGSILSLNSFRNGAAESFEVPLSDACTRHRSSSSFCEENPRLIPNLPDEISLQILARLPRICYLEVKQVSRAWKAAITSDKLFSLRKDLGTTEEWLYVLTKIDGDKLLWYALDPISRRWQKLPPMPNVAGPRTWSVMDSGIKFADLIRSWLERKDGALDQIHQNHLMPFCGCAVGAVGGSLYVLGGFLRSSALKCVWRYNPATNAWTEVSPMSIGRAYCKTGTLNNKLYVVGGVTKGRSGLIPLQYAEVYDPCSGIWSKIPNMPFSKARDQVVPNTFLASLLNPIATGMVTYRGRLLVPQSMCSWPLLVDAGGEIYDPEMDSWIDMPKGMGEGWPARRAGTKLSVPIDDKLYALDPSSSIDSAEIRVYDPFDDAWKAVSGDVPVHGFYDSEYPYLLAGLLGKLHVITKDSKLDIAVLQVDMQNLAPARDSETGIWRVVATKTGESCDELVLCQTLDV